MTLATDVSGIVASTPVHEGKAVTKGRVLFTVDPRRFEIVLDNARQSRPGAAEHRGGEGQEISRSMWT